MEDQRNYPVSNQIANAGCSAAPGSSKERCRSIGSLAITRFDVNAGTLAIPQETSYHQPMGRARKEGTWIKSVDSSQRNTLFADTLRNRTRFWHGIYHQKLNALQSVGLGILVLFYVVAWVATFHMTWPDGEAPFLEKLVYGYGTQVLICLPAFLLLWFLLRRITRK